MFDHIRDEIHPEWLFWTGDNTDHADWLQTDEINLSYTKAVTQMIKDTFQGDERAPLVFPTFGNHDTFPVNVEDFTTPNSNYQINGFKNDWLEWIG